jgi:hypothetical protein
MYDRYTSNNSDASQPTRYVTRARLVMRESSMSMRRPGVAITISTPPRRSRACAQRSRKRHVTRAPGGATPCQAGLKCCAECARAWQSETRQARKPRHPGDQGRRRPHLRPLGRAAVHARVLYPRARPKLLALLLDLNRQLARGRQHQHDGAVAGLCGWGWREEGPAGVKARAGQACSAHSGRQT